MSISNKIYALRAQFIVNSLTSGSNNLSSSVCKRNFCFFPVLSFSLGADAIRPTLRPIHSRFRHLLLLLRRRIRLRMLRNIFCFYAVSVSFMLWIWYCCFDVVIHIRRASENRAKRMDSYDSYRVHFFRLIDVMCLWFTAFVASKFLLYENSTFNFLLFLSLYLCDIFLLIFLTQFVLFQFLFF